MKKRIFCFILASLFTLFFCVSVFAAPSATIDKSNAAKGLVTINMTDFSGKTIKAMVEKGTEKYYYTLIKSPVTIPMQMGTGDYKVSVLENIGGEKYKPLVSETVNAATIDEKEMYKASVPMVEYSVSTKAVPAFKVITDGKSTDSDKVSAVYDNVINNYSYDTAKASSVKGDYVPVIDDVYNAKKGICYDYAALVGGTLRSQGIPTRLVMGYVPEIPVYHAWNEILINGDWVSVDATYDAQVVKAGKEYTMAKDKSKTKVVKIY